MKCKHWNRQLISCMKFVHFQHFQTCTHTIWTWFNLARIPSSSTKCDASAVLIKHAPFITMAACFDITHTHAWMKSCFLFLLLSQVDAISSYAYPNTHTHTVVMCDWQHIIHQQVTQQHLHTHTHISRKFLTRSVIVFFFFFIQPAKGNLKSVDNLQLILSF